MSKLGISLVVAVVLTCGATSPARADSTTPLPIVPGLYTSVWVTVDPAGGHVFVSAGQGSTSIFVLDFAGNTVATIPGEEGASSMALDPATHTLYVALHDANAVSEIDTRTLTEKTRFSIGTLTAPYSLVVAGGKLWFSCFNSGHSCVASAELDGNGITLHDLKGIDGATGLAAGGPGANLLALGGNYSSPTILGVYDVSQATPKLISTAWNPGGNTGAVDDLMFDPSGRHLLVAAHGAYFIHSFATATLKPDGSYQTGPYPSAVTTSSDGGYVAAGITTGTGYGIDLQIYSGEGLLKSWQVGPGVFPNAMAFSPDDSKLFVVTGNQNGLDFNVIDTSLTPPTPQVSVAAARNFVSAGQKATIVAQVSAAKSGRLRLYATPAGSKKTLVTTRTIGAWQQLSLAVAPRRNTRYSAELDGALPSGSVDVSVRPLVKVRLLQRGTANGRPVVLGGSVAPTHAGKRLKFVLQRLVGGRWHNVESQQFPVGSGGTVSASFTTRVASSYRTKAFFAANAAYAASASGWLRFGVR